MAKHSAKKTQPAQIAIESSSGNIFADLDLPNAEQLKIKSGLV
jgi:hypothetical protein